MVKREMEIIADANTFECLHVNKFTLNYFPLPQIRRGHSAKEASSCSQTFVKTNTFHKPSDLRKFVTKTWNHIFRLSRCRNVKIESE